MSHSEDEGGGSRGSGGSLAGVALVVAVAIVVVWLGFLVWLAIDTGASEITWSRLLVVLASVEAVAFAAIGALFGTTVQKQRVEDLKARTDAAESRAEANQTAALNGHKLAAAVKASRGSRADGSAERLSAEAQPGSDPLLALANRLFPD
ncbi:MULTISPECIES: hypothetical protein [Kitasatospora]|uniref:hypothetical protein n=1 Tax=Kitasatospora TaxID=2063 RepID=UPI000C706AEE|nr:hypothetical protein [Kitasatospora sp. GP30]MDH6142976.1 type VI protein secretion system component VasK [Kitasatospora sp. GP30]